MVIAGYHPRMPEWSALLLPVCLLAFVISAMCGFGGRLVLVAVLAPWLGAPTAVAVATPVLLFNSIGKCVLLWREISWRHGLWVMLGGIPGTFLGAQVLTALPEHLAARVVGTFVLVAVLISFMRPVRWARVSGPGLVAVGAAAGAASGIAGAGGPARALTLRSAGLVRTGLVATSAAVDVALATANIPVYVQGGLLRQEHLALIVPLVVEAWLGIAIGRALLRRLSDPAYRLVFAGVLAASSIRLML